MGVDLRARISSTACWILFPISEYVSDVLHTTVVDESMMWAGGRGAEFSFLLEWGYGWTGQHPPAGGSELESETYKGPGGYSQRLVVTRRR